MSHPYFKPINKSVDWMVDFFLAVQQAGGNPVSVLKNIDRDTLCTLISNNLVIVYKEPADDKDL